MRTSRLAAVLVSLALAGAAAAQASAAPAAKKPPTGRVRVVGPDVFRLDADHDGWGCE